MMSLKSRAVETAQSLGGTALGGTIPSTLAGRPVQAEASFETMVSGAMKSADGKGRPAMHCSGVVPMAEGEVPLRIQAHSESGTVTRSSLRDSRHNSADSELGRFSSKSPSVRPRTPSPSARKIAGSVKGSDSTGSQSSSFEKADLRDQTAHEDQCSTQSPRSSVDRLPDWWVPTLVRPMELTAEELPAELDPQVSAGAIDADQIGSSQTFSPMDGASLRMVGSESFCGAKPKISGTDAEGMRSSNRFEPESGSPGMMGSELKAWQSVGRPFPESSLTSVPGLAALDAQPWVSGSEGHLRGGYPVREVLENSSVVDAEASLPNGSMPNPLEQQLLLKPRVDSPASVLADQPMVHGAENPRQRLELPLSETADLAYGSTGERATSASPLQLVTPVSELSKTEPPPEKAPFEGGFSKGGTGAEADVTPSIKRSGMTSAGLGSAMTSDRFQPTAPEGALQQRDSGLSEESSQHSTSPFTNFESTTVDTQAVMASLAVGKTDAAPLGEVSETTQVPLPRSVSRLADQLSGEVVLMQRLRSGAMTAVLKPDADSELRVDLRRREGRLEIRAIMERGDSQAISEGWPELQQRLRSQGVHLLPLERQSSPTTSRDSADLTGERPANSGSRGKNPQTHQESHDGNSWIRGEAGQPLRGAATRSANVSAKKANHRHLLESWA